MRTNIDLDNELVEQAFHYAQVNSKPELVHLALQEFVENHQRKDVRKLIGKVKIDPDYDYKTLRQSKGS